ncbi:unnamed protein product [Urochloa decumbens]|uniref:Uncharacterized protein n=1 Tax=Urochloa decumbens TaxID=240449 RepID=A0ABC9GKU7_9POAL
MAPLPDQGSGTGATAPEAEAAELRRQASCASCGSEEPPVAARHDRSSRLSGSASFCSSSPARSTSSSATHYLPASNKLSSESIPFSVQDLSSFSSSSYESFFHIDASDLAAGAGAGGEFLDFDPTATATTRAPPAVQTMMMAAAQSYDPKRLPSSMFRARSNAAMPGDWSVTSNDSLFSIQLSHSGDLSAMYADMYYDAAGFPHFSPSGGAGDLKTLASMSSDSSSVRSGGLCVRQDCARCGGSSGGKTRKSVRFAATESVVSTEGKHSIVVSTLEVAMEEENARESATKAPPEAGWCELGCCLPSPTTAWWPRCCVCCGCGCRCKWWI